MRLLLAARRCVPGPVRSALILAALSATSAPAGAQVAQGDEHYSLEALKTEAGDVGEKLACYLKIYANGQDRDFEKQYGNAMNDDFAEFSRRVEAHVARFAPHVDAGSVPAFRFHTWHNLNFFVDRKESAVRDAPDRTVMGRCNLVAATSIERRRAMPAPAPKGRPRR